MGAVLAGLGRSAAQGLAANFGARVAGVDKINLIVRGGRALYGASAVWIGVSWYTFWRNQRVEPGSGKFPLPGRDKLAVTHPQGATDKPDLPDVHAATGALADVPVIGGIGRAGQGAIQPPAGGPSPNLLIYIGHIAQTSFGLHVGEHPKFGGVHPVHVKGSYHYKGRAIDVSGSTPKMQAFAHWVAQTYGAYVTELFWRGPGWVNIKSGKRVGHDFVTGHTDHVHVAI